MMQGVIYPNYHNILSASENFHKKEINNDLCSGIQQKNFINGIQNARNILENLERSIEKTRRYELQFLRCKAMHPHSHKTQELWESELSEDKGCCKKTESGKPSRYQVNLAESWSTMSIVCLQYQYEELSKRYEALLQAYDERCKALSEHNVELSNLQRNCKTTQAQLAHAHKVLLAVGEKYLALRYKRHAQRKWYEEQTERLKAMIRCAVMEAECARQDLDEHLSRDMAVERDAATALLLAEIRKCNNLCLENLRLKTRVQEMAPRST